MPLKILMQKKVMQTSGVDSEHKHSEIEHLSALNEWIICQNSKDSVAVNCQ